MLFHEIYGSYYDAVAAILREAVRGTLTAKKLTELVRQKAFSESLLAIPRGLQGEQWRLLRRDLTTPLEQPPGMPLTALQKRWLKALLLDPRIRLFAPAAEGLEDVVPLFTPDMFVYYDRYADGDDYADPDYIARFQTILRALREKRSLSVRFETGKQGLQERVVTPMHLEFSEKDDHFRLIAADSSRRWTINLGRLTSCELAPGTEASLREAEKPERLVFELTDRRNALERVLLHFSHLEKETERLDADRYRVTLYYDRSDETEMLIRILSFGPVIRVTEPAAFVAQLRQRILRQGEFAAFLP